MGQGLDDPPSHATSRLPAAAESAEAGRRFIDGTLRIWGLSDIADTAVLLGNELVTNAVVHARSAVVVELTRGRKRLRVAVHDHGEAPPVRRYHGLEAVSGRGLAMVEAMALDWGVVRRAGGKTVWFELPLPAPRSGGEPAGAVSALPHSGAGVAIG